MQRSKWLCACVYGCVALLTFACGRQLDNLVEEARFALDSGDNATAITKAEEALVIDPNDFDAALIRSAGYAGRAGVDLFKIAKEITKSGAEDEVFNLIHDTLVAALCTTSCAQGLSDLRAAVTALTGFTGAIKRAKEYRFQLGILQTIEAFGRPSITAQPTLAGAITATSITGSTATSGSDAQIVRDDLVAADTNLLAADIASDNVLITNIQKSYCVLKNRSADATSGETFTTAELQDRVRCELDDNRASLVAANFQSPTVTTCNDFNFSTCTATETTN